MFLLIIVEVANDLNAPEGYLVQARYGNETASEIVGEFLGTSTVQQRSRTVPLNFKILQCRQCSECDGELRDVSHRFITMGRLDV